MTLKNVKDQVIVITGASSGIGLATSKMAVKRGASVVMCSRNIKDLKHLADQLNEHGPGVALALECDVTDVNAVQAVADQAIAEFGRIDTWVNNAGIGIYGKLWEIPLEEKRQMFDVNFWGVVHGCRAAIKVLKENGGAIINIGSVLSERSIPIQGIYSASKHAVKAYTDSLRMELEAEGYPISVSLVKPAAIDTPYTEHAKSYMEHAPVHSAPVYAPEVVARAILTCAEKRTRDVYAGGQARMFAMMEALMPRLTDLFMEKMMMEDGQSDEKLDDKKRRTALGRVPSREGRTRGTYPGHVMESSVLTTAQLHPALAALIATGLGVAAAAGISYLASKRSTTRRASATAAKASPKRKLAKSSDSDADSVRH